MFFLKVLTCFVFAYAAKAQNLNILAIVEPEQEDALVGLLEETLRSSGTEATIRSLAVEENSAKEQICAQTSTEGVSLVLDFTWSKTDAVKKAASELGLPLLKADSTFSPILQALVAYLNARNATDVLIVLETEQEIDQLLYFWIGSIQIRLIAMEKLDDVTAQRVRSLRPDPTNYIIVASSTTANAMFKFAQDRGLLRLPDRWTLVYLNFSPVMFDPRTLDNSSISILVPSSRVCCNKTAPCQCPEGSNPSIVFMRSLAQLIGPTAKALSLTPLQPDCTKTDNSSEADIISLSASEQLRQSGLPLVSDEKGVRLDLHTEIYTAKAGGNVSLIATFNGTNGLSFEPGQTAPKIRRFFRVGTTEAIPWVFKNYNRESGTTSWTGYCIDFVQRMSIDMDFDYEIVEPRKGTFGKKSPDGRWDGVIGDLVSGETDLAVTSLMMTADREEVIDFVAPYFETSGISIVMRKPVRKTSLFKFMTVLRLEVWLSIIGALVATAVTLWLLDTYSPYSARNSGQKAREFTLKESFWFALTSFTPQGGGEAPRALSGRALVAAYWLFVVLMLATFTANLAAFLTVERMQSPVQSLEQLAKQSRINYTVVESSDTHQYFINMKRAEDTLYRMWKELTLNASTDRTEYRVWDYPIKEQWGHILLAINDSVPVANPAEGFKKVSERTDADFAFIHDSSLIKYEVTRNCNLTEVGEVFGERAYAVAVQQGSFLQDEITKVILNLQKIRFFDSLTDKYWNSSQLASCPDADDSEGITLESLGGVFIATLFGLALAMITLAVEVLYYKRKKTKVNQVEKVMKPEKEVDSSSPPPPFNENWKPISREPIKRSADKVSIISVYPRSNRQFLN